jgi:hypothetical protein
MTRAGVSQILVKNADGSGSDHHDVRLRAQHGEQHLIGGAAKAARHAGHSGGTVDAGDHVEPDRRPRASGWQIPVQRGGIYRIARERQQLAQCHTSGSRSPASGP